MKKTYLNFALLLLAIAASSQTNSVGNITGKVLESPTKPLEFATVTLHQATDSLLVKGAITDQEGKFEFEQVKVGSYLIKISFVGFEPYIGSKLELTSDAPTLKVKDINLTPSSMTLGTATVTAQKPFIERKLDRLVVNVENSIVSAGSSVLEVLERSPNVFVNQESSISLKGKAGVIVMIDGKPTPLAGLDLIQYLRSIPSASIEKIELITNPSAKYDAAGNAGIIDIRFKKDKNLGANGSLTLSDGQGVYNKFNASTNLNYRTKRLNLFGSYAFGQPKGFTRFYINRKFFTPDHQLESIFDQTSFIKQPITSHTGRIGLDYYATKNTVIGVMLNSNFVTSVRDGYTQSIINNPTGQLQYTTETANTLDSKNFNGFGNINLKHSFDSSGREVAVDVDYGQYDAATGQKFDSKFLNPLQQLINQSILQTDQKGTITVKSIKADYTQPLRQQAKLELGIKTSFVKTDNDILFFDIVNGVKIPDKDRSNHFIYDENVNAAYANYSRSIQQIDIQIGLRMEHTVTNGQQVTTNERFSRNYVNFFPSAAINFKLAEQHQMGVTYSRRIDRPSYRQLNPFRIFVDPYTYVVGDPQLRPVFTHSLEIAHTFQGRYLTELSYASTKDVITDVFSQDDATKVSNQIPANLQDSEVAAFSVTIPFSVQKWLNSSFNGGVYWNRYKSPFQGGTLINENTSWTAQLQNGFVLGKNGWSAELTASYQSRLVWGLFTIKDLGQLNIGVQKVSKSKNTTFKLSLTDIFYTNRISVVVQYQNMDFYTQRTWDSRVATLSVTHRFGKNTVQQARRRTTGVEEEKRRAS